MNHLTRTSGLLVRWWNFSDHGVWGPAISARRVDIQSIHPGIGSHVENHDDPIGLQTLVSTPLTRIAPAAFSKTTPTEPTQGNLSSKTFLDTWLEVGWDQEAIDDFSAELSSPTGVYELVLESGKTFRAELSALCAIRLAAALLKRPNPLFYVVPSVRSQAINHTVLLFDPRFLLPISEASIYRRALLVADQILVSRHHSFLFSSYMPELVGKVVLDDAPLSEAHARARHADNLPRSTNLMTVLSVKASTEVANVPIVRIALLGVARLAKIILSGSLRYGNISHRIISTLVGPWSSKPFLGRRDYQELKNLSRRAAVSA